MSLPAALTWTQLLPQGMHCFCTTGPAWFGQLLSERADGTPPRALAIWGKTWNDVNLQLPSWDAVVAINCPHVTTDRLESAGYAYARRFAVLPSLERARWFISLDSGRAAAASFSLYTPARRSAHLKKAVATLLARLRAPGWYRDEVIVASRKPPPLEAKLAELFPGQAIRLALSGGAPEPAINRKPSACVIDANGNVLAFVKMAVSSVSRQIVEREADMLVALEQRQGLRAPRLIFAGEVDGQYMTVQSPLDGAPAPAAFTDGHEAFLCALAVGVQKRAAETNLVAALPRRLDALQPLRPDLRERFERLLPILEQTLVSSTIVHGDFAPWNLRRRRHDGQIAAFDWEYGEIDGLPLIDQIHFRLQLGMEMDKWDVDAAARFLREMKHEAFEVEQVRAIQAVYLLDHLARLLGEGYTREHDIVSMYEKLLARLEIPTREAALV